MPGTIVLLDGTSSAGKDTIVRHYQELQDHLVLGLGIDNFMAMLPPGSVGPGAADGFNVVPHGATPADGWHVEPLPGGQQAIAGMHRAFRALALAGNDLILSHVLWGPGWLADAVDALGDLPVLYVRVTLPLDVAEAREQARGDRLPGGARAFYDLVYGRDTPCDLVLDTATTGPEACARAIADALPRAHAPDRAFARLAAEGVGTSMLDGLARRQALRGQ